MAQGCLPEGITFSTQEQIDNFQTDNPGCTEIEGNVLISGSNIVNLTGLSSIVTIKGELLISDNNILTTLDGLNSLDSIEGTLAIISNDQLTDITSLTNVVSIGGNLAIGWNYSLNNIFGLDNISYKSIQNLFIYFNDSLTTCEIKSICQYITSPDVLTSIYNNAPGCNSQEEVEAACLVGIENIIQENYLSIFPNPSSSRFTIQFSLENEEQVKLLVLNNLGQVVAIIANENLSAGEHEINWNAEGMPAGVYFYNIQIGNQAGTGKMVLMK